jgi:hypothetical protein
LKIKGRGFDIMSYYNTENTRLRAFYSPGYSAILTSLYKYNFVFNFTPYEGRDRSGLDQYSKTVFLSTSVNYNAAAFLYIAATLILDGKEDEIEAVLPCGVNTSLIFEYKPDENNQMTAWLAIDKNNRTIPFKFATHSFTVRENGKPVTKIVQSGLGVLQKTLSGYLSAIGADLHLSKFTEEELNNLQEMS